MAATAINQLYNAVTTGTHPVTALYTANNPAPSPWASTPANPASAYNAGWNPTASNVTGTNANGAVAVNNQTTPAIQLRNNDFFDKLVDVGVPIVIAGMAAAMTGGAAGAALGGGLAGGAVGGAVGGATSSAVSSGEAGTPITLGSLGKAAAIGAVGGAIGGSGVASKATGTLTNSGVNSTVASGLVKGAIGAGTGALSGAISGQGAGAGAAHGALVGGASGVAGSIFNSGNTVNTSNSTVIPPPTNTNMADDLNYIDTTGNYAQFDPTTGGYTGGGSGSGGYYDPSDPVVQNNVAAGQQYYSSGNPGGTVGNGSPAGSSGSILASLASKLFGSSGGASPQNMSLLGQLLGYGAQGVGGAMSSAAAKGAAGNFANQTKFNPYNVNTAGGSTTFTGNGVNSTLSPGQQANMTGLGKLDASSLAALQAGPAAASNQYYQQLQAQQKQGNDRFMANNADSEFGRGILSSTAGQYQTQGAIDSIHNQNLQDSVLANNFGQQQQQQQLAQLTAGLSGGNQIIGQQFAGAQLGGSLGGTASQANNAAYQPVLAANSNSNIGNLLTNAGGAINNSFNPNTNALQAYLQKIMGGP